MYKMTYEHPQRDNVIQKLNTSNSGAVRGREKGKLIRFRNNNESGISANKDKQSPRSVMKRSVPNGRQIWSAGSVEVVALLLNFFALRVSVEEGMFPFLAASTPEEIICVGRPVVGQIFSKEGSG
jgi:hypothetical protein